MKNENNDSLINFNLNLSSKTKSAMVKEALEKAKGIYPYQIEEKNITIEETGKKGIYSVSINKDGFEKQKISYARIILFALFTLCLIVAAGIFIRKMISNKNAEEIKQVQVEKINEEKIRLQKEKETQLKDLISEYKLIEENKYENIYERIELIYSLLAPSVTIENLNIDKDSFYIDFSSKNSTKVLSNFESSAALSKIKMNRTTVAQKDITSISGNFVKHFQTAGSNLSLDEKIDFYKNTINQEKSRKEKLLNTQLSAYISTIRAELHKNNCSEQYVQIKGEKENLEAEFLVYSSAENILNFLKEIQGGTENLFDIKSFHLKNSENQQHLQSLITFKTGISLKENESLSDFKEIKKYSAREISTALYKAPAVKPKVKLSESPEKKSSQVKNPQNLKKLNYIGSTKLNGKNFVMAKDEEMNVIYKLMLCETEAEGDFCMSLGNGNYKAKIRNEWFEVKK